MKTQPDPLQMLTRLRAATGSAHQRLDTALGALALAQREDCLTFLRTHAIALAPLQPTFTRFVAEELGMPCPDFTAMLDADLAERGENAATRPELAPDPAVFAPGAAAGVAYVLAGSRLGNAVLRAHGYYGRDAGMPSRYMEDDSGIAVWKALGSWMRSRTFGETEASAMTAAALAAFTQFETAFAVGTRTQQGPLQTDG